MTAAPEGPPAQRQRSKPSPRALRWGVALAVLLGIQAGFWLLWRSRPAPRAPALGTEVAAPFPAEPASGVAPASAPPRGVLHVWATWCGPCRDELPELLAVARSEGVPLVAVSVDENPASLTAFFRGPSPPEVRRDPSVAAAVGVHDLPVTLRVEDGRLVSRVQGAQRWDTPAARAWLGGRAPGAGR